MSVPDRPPPGAGPSYRFAGFEVEVARRRVTSADGAVLPVASRAFAVLVYLLEHRTRVVGKDELIRAVWQGAVVEENNLSQAVSALRRAFGDTRATPRFVATIPGRGFQFVAPVDAAPSAPPPHAFAERAAEATRPDIVPSERRTPLPQPTADDEAWRLYLHGRFHWERKSPDGIRQAIEFYRAAVERDPSFVSPRVGLADAYTTQGVFNVRPPRAAFDEARAEALRAIELDPAYAEAHAALGHIAAQCDRAWDDAARLQEHALRLKPTYGHALMWRAMLHAYSGDVPTALETVRVAQALEPMSLSFSAVAGILMYFARDYEASASHLRRIVESAPDASLARHLCAHSLLASGDADEVIALVEGSTTPGPWAMSNRARAYARCGRRAEALAWSAHVRELGARGFGIGVDMALIHLDLGEPREALTWLERAVDDLSQTMAFLNVEPAFDPVRDDPRFRAVSRRIGLG